MIIIFFEYFYWHYTIAPFGILKIMRNYQIATWHRFLITQHFRTLFSPWHRQNPSDFGKRERNLGDKILDAIADFYIRLIAACIRSVIIIGGLLMEILTLIVFIFLFIIWLGWPAIAIYSIALGLSTI